MNSPSFPVIGIGASAGGLDAFHSFFKHMPADCGMAFVVILHLPAERKSMLVDILSRWTGLRVLEGKDGTLLEPNCVYVPPPHTLVTISGNRLRSEASTGDGAFRPIDAFFDSLASELGERTVGIVLSGTGSDGALGLKAIKARNGLTIAQGKEGSSPQYPEMPTGAIATGAVDLVAPVDEMPMHLMRMRGEASRIPSLSADIDEVERMRLEICAVLRARVGHDFSGYRSQTFLRRVERRMQVQNTPTLQEYIARLEQSADEASMLFRDLLIRVTSFFRDMQTFDVLQAKVMPKLFAGKGADQTVRVWVPGCATGEEAYSLAILLREQMETMEACPRVQLFATDIDEAAIAAARLGRYPAGLLEGMSPERLEKFFVPSHGGYVVSKEIRSLCTFSAHNLIRDPPFSMMSLVSCRNLLIYMNSELQSRVIPLFHYALVPDGILLLGGAESVVQHADLFSTIDKTARIFQRLAGRGPEINMGWQRPVFASARAMQDAVTQWPIPSPKSEASVRKPYGSDPDLTHELASRSWRYEGLLGKVEPSAEAVTQLQAALGETCEELRSLAEQYQTALEELRSANEELHSVNEEMQSTNEELETSKEELQSLNEELHTVNMRLTDKISELDRSNSDLRNLFDSTEIATVFLDRHLIIRSFTPAIATLYNLIPTDQGRPLTDIVSRVNYNRLREDVAAVLADRQPLERRVTRTDRSAHYIMRILPYRDPDNAVSGVLVTFIDVTSIVQAEDALKEADIRKDVFLATLSHELRNPLAPIRTAAQVLQSPKLKPEDLQRVQTIIARQVTHMSSLLDDLLDVSRITRGAFQLKKSYVAMEEIIEAAVEAAQPTIDRREHSLRFERREARLRLEADPVRLTQILTNLLTNAAKYTPRGGVITLGTRLEAGDLQIFVRDNGVGLAPEMAGRIFDMFTQVEAQKGRSEGGLGIGLALAKGLVELHGGRIEARSNGLNEGSEFVVHLPRSIIVDEAKRQPGDGAGVAKRILIVDDHRDGAEMMRVLLHQAGHDVTVMDSAAHAFETARQQKPEVAIIDIRMPDVDGYQLAEKIRAEAWGADITLIALTGLGQPDDKRRANAAGFDFHMVKPIDPLVLKEAVEKGAATRG